MVDHVCTWKGKSSKIEQEAWNNHPSGDGDRRRLSCIHRALGPLQEAVESGPRMATEFCFDSYYILFHLSC